MRAYQDEAAPLRRRPVRSPTRELALLPRMVAIAALYVVNWDIVAYYIDRDPNDDEYLFFLEHNVAFVDFIEATSTSSPPDRAPGAASAPRPAGEEA